ncbi:MAG: glycosyltransferase [Woronichinia naegeliana WA131]|jgi:glycosyltransferase involved in cell wall biosynthesis|uniref:Glycosyltransferase n=1 Tax=Woronichinia naegeliana WA131 TaxID=2824559 RepID=A0A977KW41_9CYAN|nr:MAG: glycosyltransferase [Woronichinia naegeliana WA131]
MVNQPLISVISCFYNRSNSVQPSVDSLLNQTYSNIEVILVNDGSTDNTLEKLAAYQDPRVRLITHDNKGFVRALCNAISLSQGELIAIHGSGDISLPQRIERQVELLIKNPDVGVVGCHIKYFNIVQNQWVFIRRIVNPDQFSQLIRGNIFLHGEIMFRRTCYERVGGYREFFEFSQDYDLWLRMAPITRFEIVPEVLYQSERIEDSVTKIPSKAKKQALLSEFAIVCALTRKNQGFDPLERDGIEAFKSFVDSSGKIHYRLRSLASRYLADNQFESSKELMTEAVSLNPSVFNKFILAAIIIAQKKNLRKPIKLIFQWRSKLLNLRK